jgi:hypothetical protein
VTESGKVYVADKGNHSIRAITPNGAVTTFAGSLGVSGTGDGTGPAAQFCGPEGIAVENGFVYVADTENYTIRKITPGGVVTTLAGSPKVSGTADGTGGAAQFCNPSGITVDGDGNVYVVDGGNRLIRKVTPDGVVTTIGGVPNTHDTLNGLGAAAHFESPLAVAVSSNGILYVTNYYDSRISKGLITSSNPEPIAISGSATVVGCDTKVNGTVNPNGLATTVCFQYGKTSSYGSTTAVQNAESGAHEATFTAIITGLTPSAAYHYQIVATNANGTSHGEDQTFTTPNPQPIATTGGATGTGNNGIILNGTVNPNGLATSPYFQYGLTAAYGKATDAQDAVAGTTVKSFSATIKGLRRSTTYHYQIVATNGSGTTYGADQTFTTAANDEQESKNQPAVPIPSAAQPSAPQQADQVTSAVAKDQQEPISQTAVPGASPAASDNPRPVGQPTAAAATQEDQANSQPAESGASSISVDSQSSSSISIKAKRSTPSLVYSGKIRVLKCTDTSAICQDLTTGMAIVCTPRFRGAHPGLTAQFSRLEIVRQTNKAVYVACKANAADSTPYNTRRPLLQITF